jgi:hypothetical protein
LNANQLDRRDFSRWSLAALGGTLAGATLASNSSLAQQAPPVEPPPITPPQSVTPPSRPGPATPSPAPSERPTEPPKDADAKTEDAKPDAKKTDKKPAPPKEIHICRGLNTCAGKGLSGDNKCAGQGTCATALGAPHQCATGNLCKNQGGCGPTAGKNQCNGYGDGAVPIIEEEWYRLRKEFEARKLAIRRQSKRPKRKSPPRKPLPASKGNQPARKRNLAGTSQRRTAIPPTFSMNSPATETRKSRKPRRLAPGRSSRYAPCGHATRAGHISAGGF